MESCEQRCTTAVLFQNEWGIEEYVNTYIVIGDFRLLGTFSKQTACFFSEISNLGETILQGAVFVEALARFRFGSRSRFDSFITDPMPQAESHIARVGRTVPRYHLGRSVGEHQHPDLSYRHTGGSSGLAWSSRTQG